MTKLKFSQTLNESCAWFTRTADWYLLAVVMAVSLGQYAVVSFYENRFQASAVEHAALMQVFKTLSLLSLGFVGLFLAAIVAQTKSKDAPANEATDVEANPFKAGFNEALRAYAVVLEAMFLPSSRLYLIFALTGLCLNFAGYNHAMHVGDVTFSLFTNIFFGLSAVVYLLVFVQILSVRSRASGDAQESNT